MGFLKFFLAVVLCFATQFTYAQERGERQRPSIGVVYGSVVESGTNVPIQFSTVTLFAKRDSSLVTGGISNEEGKFRITEIPLGKYFVEVAFIGFDKVTIDNIALSPKTSIEKDFGVVELNASSEELEEATVSANQDMMKLEIDKRVFDVSQNITSTGGSANEVLENIPSVEVDIDGNVSLRGSQNVTVLIDGKPSGLTGASRQAILDQLPASSIESVEVITNPSAKFDPDGMSGIINIILKKNKLYGYSGNVSLTLGTGDNYNGAFTLSKRNDRVNVFANYSYRYADRFSERQTDRKTFSDDLTSVLDQTGEGSRKNFSHTIGAGSEFYLTDKASLYLNGTYQLSEDDDYEGIAFLTFDEVGDEISNQILYNRENTEVEDGTTLDLKFGYGMKFIPRKKELTFDFSFSKSTETEIGDFLELNNTENLYDYKEQNLYDYTFDFYSGQVDYINRIGENWKLETGGKSTLRKVGTDFTAISNASAENSFEVDSLKSNDFDFSEEIHAVYGILGRSFGKVGLQMGLRAEQAFTESYLVTTDSLFENDYFSLFPSGHLKYSIAENKDLMLSYSRRINRPRTRQLNPFPDFSNPLLLRYGNPFLLPEYTDAVEASYSWENKGIQVVTSVYYRKVNDVIRRFVTVEDDISTVTFTNLANSVNEGLEAIVTLRKWKKWSVMMSGNVYRTRSDGSNISSELNAEGYSGNANCNISWKNNGWFIQASARYRAPFVILQGEIQSILFSDLAFKKEVLKSKGSIGLRFSDLFNTREFNFDTFGDNFTQVGRRKRESQNLFLTFSYNFGKLENKSRKQRGGGGGGFDGGGEM